MISPVSDLAVAGYFIAAKRRVARTNLFVRVQGCINTDKQVYPWHPVPISGHFLGQVYGTPLINPNVA